MKDNSKAQIKARMLKKAATLWGVSANEIDMSFDPIISLLITACASEIEKISGEIDESQTRITEKIIQLMTPETVFGARPAHAILHTQPIDDSLNVHPEYMFSYKKKITQKHTTLNYKDIFYSPLQEFKIVKGTVNYLVTGDTIMETGPDKQLQSIYQGDHSNLDPSTLYIGISSPQETLALEDLSFYFELQDLETQAVFYHHLKHAKWSIQDQALDTIAGFYNSGHTHALKLDSIFNAVSNKTETIVEQLRANYSRHYITIKSALSIASEDTKCSELEQIFETNKIKLEGRVFWLKLEFPSVINPQMLEKLYCSLNAIPVLNRALNSFTYQLKDYINILPIKTENLFLDIKSISNTKGKSYKLQSKENTNSEKGSFMIRSENIGKLDHRKAKEYIAHLIELLKDESASFSLFNNDFLHKNLKNLNQLISLLEHKVFEISNEVTETNYIALKPFEKKETLLVDYWTTDGLEGNAIKSGSILKVYSGIGIKQKSSQLLTSSYGGKNDLSMDERLNAYRRSLLSRDRIVTKEDVKALCYEMYNDKISNVEIKHGYTTDIALNKGLLHCINIELSPNPKRVTEDNEWVSLNNNLLLYLEQHAVSVFPYKVILMTKTKV